MSAEQTHRLRALQLPEPDELETDGERAVIACLQRLLELHESQLKVAIRITAASRTTRQPFPHLPDRQGGRYVRIYCRVTRFLLFGVPAESLRFWMSWYLVHLCRKVNRNDILFRVEPIELWYPKDPPRMLQCTDPYLVATSQVDHGNGRLFRYAKQVIRFVTHSLSSDPVSWGLPPGYDLPVTRSEFNRVLRCLEIPPEQVSWLFKQVKTCSALAAAVTINQWLGTHYPTATASTPSLTELQIDTSWFDLPIDSAVSALCRSNPSAPDTAAVATLVELVLQLLFGLTIHRTGGRHTGLFGIGSNLDGRMIRFGRLLIQVKQDYMKELNERFRSAREAARDAVPASIDTYHNIVSERAGAMVRPHVRIVACSVRWNLLLHAALHFLPDRTTIGLHFVLYLIPHDGANALVLSCYFDPPDQATGVQRTELFVEHYHCQPVGGFHRASPATRTTELRRLFFHRSANPYEPFDQYGRNFLSKWSLTPVSQSRYQVSVNSIWGLFIDRCRQLTARLLKRLERPVTLQVPSAEDPQGQLVPITLQGPSVVGAGLALAGIASARGGLARRFGRSWILESERTLWSLVAPSLRHPSDLLWLRWLKALLKFGATSAYGHTLLQQLPETGALVPLRELLALRYGLPVRPAPSYGDVNIRYVYRSALPEFRRLDPLVPREWWGTSVVPRYSVFQEVFVHRQEYYNELAARALGDLIGDAYGLRHLKSVTEYWQDPHGSDASHWSGERLPPRLVPEMEYIDSLPGTRDLPLEVRQALCDLMAFPTIYTREQRSRT